MYLNNRAAIRKAVLVALAATLAFYTFTTLATAGTTGIVSGVVKDEVKGTPVSGVNIVVKGANLTTVTDEKGYYAITNVPPGTYQVTADIVGYTNAVKTGVVVMMDSTAGADFAMAEAVTQEKTANVTASRSLVHPDIPSTLYVVTNKQEEETKGQPNTLYQVPGLVLTQPGVVADADGVPHVRGGRAQEIAYLLEGIPITEPTTNSFGTNLVTIGLSKMQVYTGGFRAEYGNAISGVFNEIKKTGREIEGSDAEVIAGTQNFRGIRVENGSSEGPVDYYVGAYLWRTDYERAFVEQGDLADGLGKFVYRAGENDKITLLWNQGSGRVQMPTEHTMGINGPVDLAHDQGHQGYNIYSLTWSRNFSPTSFLTVRPYVYKSRAIFDGLSDPAIGGNGFWSKTTSAQTGLQVDYTNQASAKHLFKVGASSIAGNNSYHGFIPEEFFGVYFGFGDYDYTSDVNTLLLSAYAQDQIKLNDKWMLDIGARTESMKYNKKVSPDSKQTAFTPRVGLTFSPSKTNVWRLSAGRYAMFSPSSFFDRVYTDPAWEDYRTPNPTLLPEKATSIDLGFEHQFSDTMVGRITPFHREYKDLLQSAPVLVGGVPVGPNEFVSGGNGKANGVELYLSKKFGTHSSAWLSYTWMRARANASGPVDFDPDTYTYVDWDQRHTLTAVYTYDKGLWAHNLWLQYGSGLPWSTMDAYPVANTERMGSNTTVNYGLERKFSKNKIGDGIRMDVFNLFNVGTVVHRDLFGDPDSYIPPRFVNFSVYKKF